MEYIDITSHQGAHIEATQALLQGLLILAQHLVE